MNTNVRNRPDFYIWRDEPNNWKSIFGGSAWERDPETGRYYLHLFSKKQPDLNWENPEVRQEVYSLMRWWLDKGVDGFRMDVINMISKHPEFPDGAEGDGSPHFLNGPKIHEYLREMNREVLSDYMTLTVGETPGAAPEHAAVYTRPENRELDMIFTFEHMNLDQSSGEKWDLKPLALSDLKANIEKWQRGLHGVGWNSLYWNNHDQPRIVSRFGDDRTYRKESAKMLAACLHFLQGTPYIYQGEELGMTNVRFEDLADYKDIETLNMYSEKAAAGVPHEAIMAKIYAKGRDNARTPMQWTSGPNAGFSESEPWIPVNPNYTDVNAEDRGAPDSIFSFYQKLIRLRKELDVITDGDFTLLLRDHPALFVYRRKTAREQLIVCCNFSAERQEMERPDGERLLGNYGTIEPHCLRPYETVVYYRENPKPTAGKQINTH